MTLSTIRAVARRSLFFASILPLAACHQSPSGQARQTSGHRTEKPEIAIGPTLGRSPGKVVFDHWCGACHAREGQMPGTIALRAKYKGTPPAALEDRSDLTPETVGYFVRNGVSIMPRFRKTEITDAELAHLSAYLSKTER